MIIHNIYGGLGNQLFQYARGRALALRFNSEVVLDLSWFHLKQGDTLRQFQINLFPNAPWRQCTKQERIRLRPTRLRRKLANICKGHLFSKCYINELHSTYKEDTLKPPFFLEGYWQDERYFSHIRDTLYQDLAFPALPQKSLSIAQHIRKTSHAISLHVRRGDYLQPKILELYGACSLNYYTTALQYIASQTEHPEVFIFSDDPSWAKENICTKEIITHIIDIHNEEEGVHDMHLMSLCRHHIIANSSFSWWGAWLAQQNGIVVAPRPWFTHENFSHFDPCPKNWHRLPLN